MKLTLPYQKGFSRLKFQFAILALLAFSLFSWSATSARAADPIGSSPASGTLGTTFTLKTGGYAAGEKVYLWTTDPKGEAMDAGYIRADSSGNIELRVETSDPDGLAEDAEGNYTRFITKYDDDGNLTEAYLRVILYKPSIGGWYLTGQGEIAGTTKTFNFQIIDGAKATTSEAISSSPSNGSLGTVFTLKASGYLPYERVNLWTTDPKAAALEADYIQADSSGNIELKVETTDPYAKASDEGSNYTTLVTLYDDDGNVTETYLKVILYQPQIGNWYVTGQGATTGVTKVFSFNINS